MVQFAESDAVEASSSGLCRVGGWSIAPTFASRLAVRSDMPPACVSTCRSAIPSPAAGQMRCLFIGISHKTLKTSSMIGLSTFKCD